MGDGAHLRVDRGEHIVEQVDVCPLVARAGQRDPRLLRVRVRA